MFFESLGIQKKKKWGLWSLSALAGNAFEMAGLALEHRDFENLPNRVSLVGTCPRTLPEAAYNFEEAYSLNDSKGPDAVPSFTD